MISIIIPVYNSEKYISETIDSVLNQTYKNFEIILINDGSTDSSEDICISYTKKDPRIKLISQKNKGLSYSRNIGIDNSKGDFLFFLDSDDILSEFALEILLDSIGKEKRNIAISNFIKFKKGINIRSENIDGFYSIKVYNTEKYLEEVFLLQKNTYAWGTLIPKNIIEDIRFPNSKYFEDIATMYKIFLKSEKIKFINENLIFYRQHKHSIVSNMDEKKSLDYIEAVDKMCKDVCEIIPSLVNVSKVIQCYTKISILEWKNSNEFSYNLNKQEQYINENIYIAEKEVKIYLQKFKFKIFRISPKLYFLINSLKKLIIKI